MDHDHTATAFHCEYIAGGARDLKVKQEARDNTRYGGGSGVEWKETRGARTNLFDFEPLL
jgi:hypothetical protein